MDEFMKSVQPRAQSGNLIKDQHYLVVQDGRLHYAGKYELLYHTGSGDGMETVYRFNNLGAPHDETCYRWRDTKQFIQISRAELEFFLTISL